MVKRHESCWTPANYQLSMFNVQLSFIQSDFARSEATKQSVQLEKYRQRLLALYWIPWKFYNPKHRDCVARPSDSLAKSASDFPSQTGVWEGVVQNNYQLLIINVQFVLRRVLGTSKLIQLQYFLNLIFHF